MAVKLDLPFLAGNGEVPLLLDANAGFYEGQKEGQSYVYVERYAVKKTAYEPLPLGTQSEQRPDAYLVKETNYSNIGGGFITIDRHYAIKPGFLDQEEPIPPGELAPIAWFDLEAITYTRQERGAIGFPDPFQITINIESYRFPDDGNLSFLVIDQKTNTVLARAARRYYRTEELEALEDADNLNLVPRFYSFAPGTTLIQVPIAADRVRIYQGDIYEVTSFLADLS